MRCDMQLCDGGRAEGEEDRAVDGPRVRQRDDDDAALQGVQAALQQSTRLRERYQGVSTQRRLSTAGIYIQYIRALLLNRT